MNNTVTRSDGRQIVLNVAIGFLLVAVAAIGIDQWPRGERPTSFGRLEFPITDTDREKSDAAIAVRDAIDAALSVGVDPLSPPLSAIDSPPSAVLDALIDQGFLEARWRDSVDETTIRIRRCGDRIGVVVESAVDPDPDDSQWWLSNGCGDDADLVRGAFVALSRQEADR